MTLLEIDIQILEWGSARNLTQFNPTTENMLFKEEMEEYNEAVAGNNVNAMVDAICDMYVVYIQTMNKEAMHVSSDSDKFTEPLVYSNGIMFVGLELMAEMLGFDFELCMEETLKEINDRKGFINSDGKFQKYVIGEVGYVDGYKADYSACRRKEDG